MAPRKHERTRDRVSAVQVLYTSELQGKAPSELLDCGLALIARELAPESEEEARTFGRIEEGALTDYALCLIKGVQEHGDAIDEKLAAASENWALSRMPIVDRSILRLAVFEMEHCDDVPVSVTINEAVELAKGFGGEDDSPRFVNGVLGRIARQMEGEAGAAADEAAPAEGGAEGGSKALVAEGARPVPEGAAIPAVVGASAAAAVVQAEV